MITLDSRGNGNNNALLRAGQFHISGLAYGRRDHLIMHVNIIEKEVG